MTTTTPTYILAVLRIDRDVTDPNEVILEDEALSGLNARLSEFYAETVGGVTDVLVPQVVTLATASPEAYKILAAAIEVGADGDMIGAYADTQQGANEGEALARTIVADARLERA